MENVLAAMRNNFCQNNSENDKKRKNTECCNLRVKTKEECLSNHLNEKVEKEEIVIINHKNCSEKSRQINANIRKLHIEEEKETRQCSQPIKHENKDSDDQETHTDSLLVYESTDEETDLRMDIVKEEIDIKEEIDLVEDQYDSSCSSEPPSNFRDELCSVLKFEDTEDSNLGFADTFEAPQEEEEYDKMFKVCQHIYESENSNNKQNEDYNEDYDKNENSYKDEDYKCKLDNNEYDNNVGIINLENIKRKRKDKIKRQAPTNVIPNSKSNPVEKDFKWCDKVRGKACFLCFDDERYQTKESLIDHIRENHHQAKLQVYRSEPEDGLDKVKKEFHMVKSITQPLSVCIECYVVFYSAKGADMHMINHIKSHIETMPRFHEFRTCCRGNSAYCLQPLIICGEQKCRNQIHRTASSLRRHKSIHTSLYWWNKWNESQLIKGLKSREPKTFLRSTLSLLDSVEDSSPSVESTSSSNSKIENFKQHESEKNYISDNHNGNTIINKLVVKRNNSVDVENTTVTNVLSEMQQKFCNSADCYSVNNLSFSKDFKTKSKIRTGDIRKAVSLNFENKETVNNILSKMQQNFCDALDDGVNDPLDSSVNISDKDLIWKTGKKKRLYDKKQPLNTRDLSSSTSGTDLCTISKAVPDANKDVLPEGWEIQVKKRTSGLSVGKFDVYYISPKGQKLQSGKEIKKYEKMKKYCREEGDEVNMRQLRLSRRARKKVSPKTGDEETPKKNKCHPKGYTKSKNKEESEVKKYWDKYELIDVAVENTKEDYLNYNNYDSLVIEQVTSGDSIPISLDRTTLLQLQDSSTTVTSCQQLACCSPSGGRKRPRNEDLRKHNHAKQARKYQEQYIPVSTKKTVKARSVDSGCGCTQQCFERVGDENITAVHDEFWASSYENNQTAYIQSHTTFKKVKRQYLNDKTKQRYHVNAGDEVVQVCKKAFASFLGLNQSRIESAINNMTSSGVPVPDGNSNHLRVSPQQLIMDHINSFPEITNHYKSKKQMWKLYKDRLLANYPAHEPVSQHYYKKCLSSKKSSTALTI